LICRREWFCQQGRVETWLTALGAYDLSAMNLGDGQWSWLVRRGGLDIIEGRADSLAEAQQAAEAAVGGRALSGSSPAAWALRRPRAFWISMCNIIGLLCSVAGVVLLFWFALPNAAPGGPQALGARGPDPGWEAENRRYVRNAHIGLVLVVIGTLMEGVPPLCTAIGSARRRPRVARQRPR
jgi:hypothetical protein